MFAQWDGTEPREGLQLPPRYQWKAVFTDLTDIVVSETKIPSKSQAGKEYTAKYCAVRFRYGNPPEGIPVVRESTLEAELTLDEIAPPEAMEAGGDQDDLEEGEVASDEDEEEADDEEAVGEEAVDEEAVDEEEDVEEEEAVAEDKGDEKVRTPEQNLLINCSLPHKHTLG